MQPPQAALAAQPLPWGLSAPPPLYLSPRHRAVGTWQLRGPFLMGVQRPETGCRSRQIGESRHIAPSRVDTWYQLSGRCSQSWSRGW